MLINEIRLRECLESTAIPFEYFQFKKGSAVAPPFIVYLYPSSNNFGSDNIVYVTVKKPRIEYYFDQRNIDEQKRLEDAFTEYGFYWEQVETTYLEHPESMWMVVYDLS